MRELPQGTNRLRRQEAAQSRGGSVQCSKSKLSYDLRCTARRACQRTRGPATILRDINRVQDRTASAPAGLG